MRSYLLVLGIATLGHQPTPPPTRSWWWPTPESTSRCTYTTTTVFSHATHALKQPLSPSLDRLKYWPMEPSDPDTSPWGRHGQPCAVHSWGPCPNWGAPAHGPSSLSHQGEEEGEEDEDDAHTVVIGPIGAPAIRRMARISIGPWGRP
jgi:hypothetical protein